MKATSVWKGSKSNPSVKGFFFCKSRISLVQMKWNSCRSENCYVFPVKHANYEGGSVFSHWEGGTCFTTLHILHITHRTHIAKHMIFLYFPFQSKIQFQFIRFSYVILISKNSVSDYVECGFLTENGGKLVLFERHFLCEFYWICTWRF